MASEFVLYSYYRSSASYRVRIALNLKNIKYEYRPVHLLNNGGEQHGPEYRKLNPLKQVPCLIHAGHPIAQSMAIFDYLENISPEPHLFPLEPFDRAVVTQICEIVNSGIQPLQNAAVMQELEKTYGFSAEQKKNWIKEWNHRGLRALEDLLKMTAGDYAFGDDVTAADCFIVPQIFSARRFGVELENYPTVLQVYHAAEELEPFVLAHPSRQPDSE